MLAPSTRIGRYEVKSPLGKGGMGSLYIARDPNTDRLVALKLLSAHLDSDELKARFALEAKALASLNHPSIVDIYDSGQFRGTPFIVMEFVRGETLDEMIRRSAPISLSRKLTLIADLCAGLAHAHDAGVIHRDIKPANLMVEDRSQRLKIVDFGIARVTEGLTRIGQMTKVNMQIGTPGYMSPEQIEGGAIDHRSDLFAVGVVLYELLSNSTAFPGNSTRQIERKVLEEEPIPLNSLLPDLDPAIQAIVDRALQKAPADRYQSGAEFAEALHAVQRRLPEPESGTRDGRSTPSPGGAGRSSPTPLGKSSKAEMAYQRCRAAYVEGAVDVAKRFAVEALVEDPAHVEARAFIRKVDPQMWVPPAPPRHGTVPPTHVSRSTESPTTDVTGSDLIEATMLARRPEHGSWDSPPDSESESWDPLERTIVARPGGQTSGRTPWTSSGVNPSTASAGIDATLLIPHHDEPGDWQAAPPPGSEQKAWDPYERTIVAPPTEAAVSRRSSGRRDALRPARRVPWVAVAWGVGALVFVGAAGVATWVLLLRGEGGVRLIIEKPEGGTISTERWVCGSAGDACSATLDEESLVEFEATPDTGFRFTGFVGDCAPGGRTRMTGPRSCGATFERVVETPSAPKVLLTITPATGGTVIGSGILCGGPNKLCSAEHPQGTVVTLTASADEGYRFRGFAGPCGSGTTIKTTLNGPVTCAPRFDRAETAVTKNPTQPPGADPGAPPPVSSASSSSAGGVAGPGAAGGAGPGAGGTGLAGGAGPGTGPTAATAAATSASEGGPIGGTRSETKPAPPPLTDEEYKAKVAKEEEEARKKAEEAKKKAEEEARANIEKTLKALPPAFADLDFPAIQRVFPTAPISIRDQFRQYQTLAYSYAGAFDFKQLDAAAGRALVEVDAKQVWKPKAGNKQEADFQVTFELFKREDHWLIGRWTVRPKKK